MTSITTYYGAHLVINYKKGSIVSKIMNLKANEKFGRNVTK
jgi:hypothetical protein